MSSLLCLCFDVLLLGLLRITSVLQHGKHLQAAPQAAPQAANQAATQAATQAPTQAATQALKPG